MVDHRPRAGAPKPASHPSSLLAGGKESPVDGGGRFSIRSGASEYAAYGSARGWQGQFEIPQVLLQRVTMTGFIFIDHADRFGPAVEHIAGLMAAGKLVHRETVVDGLEHARDALNGLFAGENIGKMVVRVAEPTTGRAVQSAAAGVAGAG
jgi:hypothetical protein